LTETRELNVEGIIKAKEWHLENGKRTYSVGLNMAETTF
jgi:hypothetical protein